MTANAAPPADATPERQPPSAPPAPAKAREPQGPWATAIPRIEDYAGRLPAGHRAALSEFRRAHPDIDPSERERFAQAVLAERAGYGRELSEDSASTYTRWLERMEAMQAALVLARGEHIGIAIAGTDENGRGFALIGFDGVRPLYRFTQNVNAAISTGANLVRMNPSFDGSLGASVSGNGLYVNVNDHGEIYQHTEFQLPNNGGSRIVLAEVPGYSGGDRSHMTHVTGTVTGWGFNGNLTGMTPRLWIRAHIQQYTSDITGYGMQYPAQLMTTANPVTGQPQVRSVMGTTSLGLTTTNKGRYTYSAQSFDQSLWDYPYYIHFYAASNDGSSFSTLGQDEPASKNVVTMASVSDVTRNATGNYTGGGGVSGFSSRGPSFDGRIKPDLAANGESLTSADSTSGTSTKSGTSMATPNASGSTVLLIDYFRNRFRGNFLRASTLKALLANTADDRGNTGPDYSYGWGIVNVRKAAEILRRYADDPRSRVVVEDTLNTGENRTWTYTYDGSGPIRATLSWTDPAGVGQGSTSTDRTPRVVNNLNLRLIGPTGTTYYPYVMPFTTGTGTYAAYDDNLRGVAATTGDNVTDNIEQIYIPTPAAGNYTVQITYNGTLSGSKQVFSFATAGAGRTDPVSANVTGISPSTGNATDNFVVTVNGTGFLLGSSVELRRAGSPDGEAYGEELGGNAALSSIRCRFDTATLAKGYWDVVVRNPDGTESRLPNAFLLPQGGATGAGVDLYTHGFEAGSGGLTLDGGWTVGSPTKSGLTPAGPDSAYGGANALCYQLASMYEPSLSPARRVMLPTVSTVGYTGIRLSFQRFLGVAYNQSGAPGSRHADYARIEWSGNGTGWSSLFVNSSAVTDADWQNVSINLPAGAAGQATLYLRFGIESDATQESFGWNLDDLKISGNSTAASLPPTFASAAPTQAVVGQAFTYDVVTADADTASANLTLSAAGLPAWLAFTPGPNGTGTLAGVPPASGTANGTLQVTDGTYTTYQAVSLLLVPASGNTPPVIGTSSLPDAFVSVAYSANVTASDADGHPITFTLGTHPVWLALTDNGNGTALLTGTPDSTQSGNVAVTLSATDGLNSAQRNYTLTVRPRATVGFGSTGYSVSEGNATANLTVNRASGTYGAVTINYTTSNGTALAGSDFTAVTGMLNWADGDSVAKTISVPINNDAFTEGNESFTVTLSALTGIAEPGVLSATVTINDNDNNAAPVVTIVSPSGSVGVLDRTDTLLLNATIADDAKPAWGNLTTTWSQVSGPPAQNATFGSPASANTTVTFPVNGTYVLRLTANDGEFSGSRDLRIVVGTVSAPVAGTGIRREVYSNLTGTEVANLTSSSKFINGLPDSTSTLTALFEAPSGVADNYGQRMRGYFISAETGNHVFVIASDDSSELWLSTDATPANKTKIAYVAGYTSSREWTKFTTQTSNGVVLQAGQPYYIEALMKEGSGGDNLAVGVTFPSAPIEKPITGNRLAAFEEIPPNAAPQVDPGPGPAASAGSPAVLAGSVSDDGKPANATVSVAWSRLAGPGNVTFGNASAAATTATFGVAGNYTLRLAASDGVSTVYQNLAVIVTPPNSPPTISAISDTVTVSNVPTPPIAFTVGDNETPAGNLSVDVSSGNTVLVPNLNLGLGGSGANRSVTVTPASNRAGSANITLTVTDGSLTTHTTFLLTVTPTFDSWIDEFGVGAQEGPDDDPDRDGRSNLFEYSTHGNPADAASTPSPEISVTTDGDHDYLMLGVARNPAATDVSMWVEVSEDLALWSSGAPHTTTLTNNATFLEVRDNTSMQGASKRFIRLRVQRP